MTPLATLDGNNDTNRANSKCVSTNGRMEERSAQFPEISELVFASSMRIKTTLSGMGVAAVVFATTAFYLFPAQYVGSSSVRILQRENYLLTSQQSRNEDAAFVRAQSALILQEQTLALALSDKELGEVVDPTHSDDLVGWLKDLIKVEVTPGTDLLNVVAQHPSQAIAVRASRALTQAYLATTTQQLRSNRQNRIAELEKTALEVDEKLMQQWKLLQSKAKEAGAGTPQSVSVYEQLNIQSLRENTQRLRLLQQQRSQLELQLVAERNTKTPIVVPSLDSAIQDALSQNQEAISLREQIRQTDIKIKKLEDIVQSKNAPQLVKQQSEKAYYVAALSQVEANVAAIERQRRNNQGAPNNASTKAAELEQKLQLLESEISHLQESTAEMEASFEVSNGSIGVELEMIRHEIERQERLADQLWKTIQELRIEERAEPRVALVTLAPDMAKLSRAKQFKAIASAAVFGGVFAILAVGLMEWSSCIVRRPIDVQDRARMRVFGVRRARSSAKNFTRGKRNAAVSSSEGADEIVAQLLIAADAKRSLPSILISSASKETGKATVAIELAQSVMQTGRSAIIVACDHCDWMASDQDSLSKSELNKLRSQKGQMIESINTSSEFGMDYIILDNGPETASRLSAQLPDLIARLSQSYDSVLVLAPPILINPSSLPMAKLVNLALLVGKFGCSRSDELAEARQQLESANCKVLGTLMVPRRTDDSRRSLSVRKLPGLDSPMQSLDVQESSILNDIQDLHEQAIQLDTAPIFHSPHAAPAPIQTSSRISNRKPE